MTLLYNCNDNRNHDIDLLQNTKGDSKQGAYAPSYLLAHYLQVPWRIGQLHYKFKRSNIFTVSGTTVHSLYIKIISFLLNPS